MTTACAPPRILPGASLLEWTVGKAGPEWAEGTGAGRYPPSSFSHANSLYLFGLKSERQWPGLSPGSISQSLRI